MWRHHRKKKKKSKMTAMEHPNGKRDDQENNK